MVTVAGRKPYKTVVVRFGKIEFKQFRRWLRELFCSPNASMEDLVQRASYLLIRDRHRAELEYKAVDALLEQQGGDAPGQSLVLMLARMTGMVEEGI